MTRPPESCALQRTVEFMRTPYVVKILELLHHKEQPSTPVGDDAALYATAVRLLATAGLIDPPSTTDIHKGQSADALRLTDKGAEVAEVVAQLCRE